MKKKLAADMDRRAAILDILSDHVILAFPLPLNGCRYGWLFGRAGEDVEDSDKYDVSRLSVLMFAIVLVTS